MQDFKNSLVWQKAHALTLEIYRDSRAYLREELYGLTSQIRRVSSSIGANIAEASARIRCRAVGAAIIRVRTSVSSC